MSPEVKATAVELLLDVADDNDMRLTKSEVAILLDALLAAPSLVAELVLGAEK